VCVCGVLGSVVRAKAGWNFESVLRCLDAAEGREDDRMQLIIK
jgi:hypothetical protein